MTFRLSQDLETGQIVLVNLAGSEITPPTHDDSLLLEDGYYLLLESGDTLLLESAA